MDFTTVEIQEAAIINCTKSKINIKVAVLITKPVVDNANEHYQMNQHNNNIKNIEITLTIIIMNKQRTYSDVLRIHKTQNSKRETVLDSNTRMHFK